MMHLYTERIKNKFKAVIGTHVFIKKNISINFYIQYKNTLNFYIQYKNLK